MLRAIDVMNSDIARIHESATVAKAVQLMKDRACRSLIVDRQNEQDSYGILTETDVLYKVIAQAKDPETLLVSDIMTKPCIIVSPSATIEDVAHLFVKHRLLRVPVVQEKLLGMVSVADLLRHYPAVSQPHLEEELNQARQYANRICAKQGARSPACIAAWKMLETLQSELTEQNIDQLLKRTFEEYCEEFPEDSNSEFYANLCGG